MPKYWVKNYFAHGSFPEVGRKQKTEKKRERLNDGDNNGQATHGARKPPGPTMASFASVHHNKWSTQATRTNNGQSSCILLNYCINKDQKINFIPP